MLNISDFTFDMGIIQHLCQHTATPMFIRVRFVVSEQINKQTDELIKFWLNTHSHTHEEIWREGNKSHSTYFTITLIDDCFNYSRVWDSCDVVVEI